MVILLKLIMIFLGLKVIGWESKLNKFFTLHILFLQVHYILKDLVRKSIGETQVRSEIRIC